MSVSLLNLLLESRVSGAKASLSITYGFISRCLYRVCATRGVARGDDNARKLHEGVSRIARAEDIIRGSANGLDRSTGGSMSLKMQGLERQRTRGEVLNRQEYLSVSVENLWYQNFQESKYFIRNVYFLHYKILKKLSNNKSRLSRQVDLRDISIRLIKNPPKAVHYETWFTVV